MFSDELYKEIERIEAKLAQAEQALEEFGSKTDKIHGQVIDLEQVEALHDVNDEDFNQQLKRAYRAYDRAYLQEVKQGEIVKQLKRQLTKLNSLIVFYEK